MKEVTDDTFVIVRGDETERVSRERIVPVTGETPTAGADEAQTAPTGIHGDPPRVAVRPKREQ